MKKLIFILILFTTSLLFAADVDHFVVEVKPNPIEVNKAEDLIVKAVDANWNVVTDYEWDAVISVLDSNGNDVSDDSTIVEVPNDWIVSFTADDWWEKIFSKWLVFKKSWSYVVKISDVTDDSIEWEVTVQVNPENNTKVKGNINIQSPINWSVEKKLPIEVIATTNLPNTVYQIFVDWQKVKEWLTDENWWINDTIDSLTNWDHTLQIKLTDWEWKVLWQSQQISFKYEASQNVDLFKSIEIKPSNNVNQWDKVTFFVNTDKSVQSAEILLKGLWSYPMDKQEDWKFVLQMTMDTPWTYEISVKLNNWKEEKEYDKVAYLTVKENVVIKNIKINIDKKNKVVNVSWDFTGKPAYFKVKWGENKEDLDKEKIVSENKISLSWLELINKKYYLQIIPLDSSYNPVGHPSNVIEIKSWVHNAPTCVVKNIRIKLKIINWKHYLVWDKVNGVEKYIISVADDPKWPFNKLWETTDTKREYPFDKNAKKTIYKFYKVEGVCSDWQTVQIWNIKKVKVWPSNVILILVLMSLIIYSIYRLHKLS